MTNSSNQRKYEYPILSDHKKIGKRFIPPLMHMLNINEIGWVDHLMPELIWIGLLNDKYGVKDGTTLALNMAKACMDILESDTKQWFASTSAYATLTSDQEKKFISNLTSEELILIKQNLVLLVAFYPKCPFNFLFEQPKPQFENFKESLPRFKDIVSQLYDRREKPAMFVQATAVYIGLITSVLHIKKDSSLVNLQAIVDYPDTEESKRVAASVRATVTALLGNSNFVKSSTWSRYFWNQGLTLEPCDHKAVWEAYEQSTGLAGN